MSKTSVTLAALGLFVSVGAMGAAVTISSSQATASAGTDSIFNNASQYSYGTSIPDSTLLSPSYLSGYANLQIDKSIIGGQTLLSSGFDLKRGAVIGAYTRASIDSLYFSVDADTSYDISGLLNVDASSGSVAGRVNFYAYLLDLDTFQYLNYSSQISTLTVDESFVVGGNGGDASNLSDGSLTGQLLAGHSYQWATGVYLESTTTGDLGATAIGNMLLRIGPSDATVPEPSSLALALAAALGVMAAARARPALPQTPMPSDPA